MSLSNGLALLGGGLGAALVVAPTMEPRQAQLVRIAGYVAAGYGAFLVLREFKASGGLAGFALDSLFGAPDRIEQRDERTDVAGSALASSATSARPGTSRPFVIPLVGAFESPRDGGTIDRGFMRASYPVTIRLENRSDEAVRGAVAIDAAESYPLGSDESVSFVGPGLTLAPGEARRLTYQMPFGGGRVNYGGTPSVLAKLSFAGRTLAVASYEVE